MHSAADGARLRLEVFVLPGIGEVRAGDDLAAIIAAAAGPAASRLADGDILAVTSKIVSKAEGRQMAATDREQAIADETVRVVATRAHPGGVTRIVENRQGLVMAAAGVDASNVEHGTVLLLPVDPDASARALCTALRAATGLHLGVLITDTVGRPWRDGQTDIAIGAAGVAVLDDLRGTADAHGRRLDVTVAAVADEIAGATDLIKGKTSGNPVAVLRGLGHLVGAIDAGDRGARRLLRDSANDMFRVGSAEAYAEGYAAGLAAGAAGAGTASESGGAVAFVAPMDPGADGAPANDDEVGTTRAADDMSVSADLPKSAPSALRKRDFAATRGIPGDDLLGSPPSALPRGHIAATRGTPAAGDGAPGSELQVAAPVERPNGPEVSSRERAAAELPVGVPSERPNGPEVASHEMQSGELPVAAAPGPGKGPEVAFHEMQSGELPVAAPVERPNGPEVSSREVPVAELSVEATSLRANGPEVTSRGTATA
ncbi:coenzyme F420-0:L-glutamate ligase [Cryobacterium sp. N22]|uniref:coenzyme F420-0:L-glutamate ligase n=1 Tax=Cryobacterium sp. N22 TaxID=2048290 RepID=UPI000CE510F8